MDWSDLIANVVTTLAFLVFLGIVWWAWSGRQKRRFELASQAPFALPDEWEEGGENRR